MIVDICEALKMIVDKHCWSFTAGEGTGSVIEFDFGKKIKRKKPLSNKYLSEEQRAFQGEYDLFVECSWRLDERKDVICSSKDSNKENGVIVSGLKRLVNKKVISIEIHKPAYDLDLYFINNLTLKIFCDETNSAENVDNFTFATPERNYIVGCKSLIRYEKRTFY
jgi:hypothetical protein